MGELKTVSSRLCSCTRCAFVLAWDYSNNDDSTPFLQYRTPEQFWGCSEITILPKDKAQQKEQLQSQPTQQLQQLQTDKTIIGYFASWQWVRLKKMGEAASPTYYRVYV